MKSFQSLSESSTHHDGSSTSIINGLYIGPSSALPNSMNKTIKVEIKSVYGKETIYPACQISSVFASLAKQTTLTAREVKLIKELGYEIEVITSQPKSL